MEVFDYDMGNCCGHGGELILVDWESRRYAALLLTTLEVEIIIT